MPDLTIRSAATPDEARTRAAGAGLIVLNEPLAGEGTDDLLADLLRTEPATRFICAMTAPPPAKRVLRLAGVLNVEKLLYQPLDPDELARAIAEMTGTALAQPDPAEAEAADLAEIWKEHLPEVLDRVGAIEGAIVAQLEGKLTSAIAEDARRQAHTLAGTAALFGFARAGTLARQIEAAFPGKREDAPRLAQLAVELRAEVTSPAAARSHTADPRAEEPVVLLLTADLELGPRIASALGERDLRTMVSKDVTRADQLARRVGLHAVVVDLELPGAIEIVRSFAGSTGGPPVVALAATDSTGDRLEVARAGARTFIERTAPASEITADLLALLKGQGDKPKVLAVDDDPAVVAGIRVMLEPSFEVTTLSEPLRFWDVLERAAPDLVLLDLSMPMVDGIELCRTLRLDPRWSRVPVLFLTARTDRETVMRIFGAGADDFVAKPVSPAELRERIANRIARVRDLIRAVEGPAAAEGAHAVGTPYSRTHDVVVVEDDRALSNLLAQGLRARGYSVEWYADGLIAAAALTGSAPAVRPAVLLLDVDLPGMDGHSLLRKLARDGALKTTRVIMLTLRSNEDEILTALQSGAFDHVAKPFSMPILIERVRRALETPH